MLWIKGQALQFAVGLGRHRDKPLAPQVDVWRYGEHIQRVGKIRRCGKRQLLPLMQDGLNVDQAGAGNRRGMIGEFE